MSPIQPQRREFSVDGPLPAGVVALEASAGTGKTYALTALATRFIAEGRLSASQLCMVTFTEAATAELRGRIRGRISETVAHLDAVIAGTAATTDDPVVAAVADTTTDEVIVRRDALRRALAEFDTATISTIHGFCTRVLAGRGPEARLVTSDAAQVQEAASDIALAVVADDPELDLDPKRVATGASQVLQMPTARLVGAYVHRDHQTLRTSQLESVTHTDRVVEITERVVAEVRERRAERAERTFDSLLSDTCDLLAGPDAAMVIRSLRERFRIVLIDEFQDTDQVQWEIFRRAFIDPVPQADQPGAGGPENAGETHRAVVIVGDPKQSIYRFRSAEIAAYLDAVHTADEVLTLSTNWRSDAPLLEGLGYLMEGFEFGSPEVAFTPVRAAPGHDDPGLVGDDERPVQLRVIDSGADKSSADPTRRAVRRDLIGVVQGLLDGRMELVSGHRRRVLEARDIAVLTRSNADGRAIAELLSGVGIPAASSSGGSVLASAAAQQWQILLRALERPGAAGAARAAALGWFLGVTPANLADFSDSDALELHDTLRRWRSELRRGGIPALLAAARAVGLNRRVLGRFGGERDLTDLDHVAELLQTLTTSRSPAALLGALVAAQRAVDEDRTLVELAERRIDRDDDAVQIMTIHRSKGLEFPVVLVPSLWASTNPSGSMPHAVIDGQRCLDGSWVAGYDKSRNDVLRAAAAAEDHAEARRLLYVAVTRARHRCIIWWGRDGVKSVRPLNELLEHRLGRELSGAADLEPLSRGAPDTVSTTVIPIDLAAPRPDGGVAGGSDAAGARSAASTWAVSRPWRFEFEPSWRIWSFTSIVADARQPDWSGRHDPSPDSIPVLGGTDEAVADGTETAVLEPIGTPLADAPAGATFGTLMHHVLERADFTAQPLEEHLSGLCAEALARRPLAIGADELGSGLAHALRTPLGGPLGSVALTDLARGDRIDELEFHLPLGRLRASDLAAVLVDTLGGDDPIRPWAARLAGSAASDGETTSGEFGIDLAGRLTGSIDLTLRHGVGDSARYFVADYKSNRLAHRGAYRPEALIEAMAHHHYPLQAALYLVALHRYLRWRLRAYDPAVHLGGAAYLFIRGMDPESTDGHGVFWWTPTTDAVLALDTVLGADGADGVGHRGER